MEDRSNKTIICSVLFLDIVEYSKKAVSGQISLKDRFNTYLSEAIHDVPVSDRIILDTGDGAAVNFLGDVESALTAALRLRASLLAEDIAIDPPLLVRIGINLGPVRLVRDINGQPNIVGDGINVAQRVMAFADPSQILVTRSYFDAVSRLSDQYTGMFHYQGSRTDKHVREHEIYAIGYPGDQTGKAEHFTPPAASSRVGALLDKVRAMGRTVAVKPTVLTEKSDARQRRIYIGLVAVPLLLLVGMFVLIPDKKVAPPPAEVEIMPSESPVVEVQPAPVKASEVVAATPLMASAVKVAVAPPKTHDVKLAANDKSSSKVLEKQKSDLAALKKQIAVERSAERGPAKKSDDALDGKLDSVAEATISVVCKDKDDVQLFVDSANKGKISSGRLSVTVKPGKHKIILTHTSFGIYSEEVTIEPGKTHSFKPKVCN
ncbi:adenylate/guanylate cyclase domain-containing protein [Gallionella capsiferriformans]|uniref:Adenylyl cyclase class-3/4/guanylyl cyclase n=1 Tax=Gallionella capsiferriformans (strain ES-2) TaxID=395494 RepID=D9SFB1_GALCS|nr:adenylate/guanylate cyclase domain-containing protein [Gallionella capsiferriformans]ADL55208.1 adenylyl cyclase class-3/4/guanylyl cyclase [Gallionella capsiferriformans ES-2]